MRSGLLSLAVFASTLTLTAQTNFTTTVQDMDGSALRVADFNGDGRPDLLTWGSRSRGEWALADNTGKAAFQQSTGFAGNLDFQAAEVGDFNGDGKPDVAACAATSSSSAVLAIYTNSGPSGFTYNGGLALAQNGCTGLAIGDVNRDGKPDVVVSEVSYNSPNAASTNTIETFLNNGSGGFGTPVTLAALNFDDAAHSITNCSISGMAGGDFFADGNYSLVIATACYPSGGNPRATYTTLFTGHGAANGQYTFSRVTNAPSNYVMNPAVVYDLDHDGNPDVIFNGRQSGSLSGRLYQGHNNGGANFTFTDITPTFGTAVTPIAFNDVKVADVNKDGSQDLLATFLGADSMTSSTSYDAYSMILNGSPGGTYTVGQYWLMGEANTVSPGGIAALDYNVDQKLDVVVHSNNNNIPKDNLYIYTNAPGKNSCAVPEQRNTNVLCTPAQGSTVSNPVTIVGASNVPLFMATNLYLDDQLAGKFTDQAVTKQIQMSVGAHRLVIVSYNSSGQAFTTSSSFNVVDACLPQSSGVLICSPTSGSTPNSPITVKAGAVAQNGNITALRVYIDDQPVATVNNPSVTTSFYMNQQVTVGVGTHRMVVVGYQSDGGAVTNSVSFTVVVGSGTCYPQNAGVAICSPSSYGGTVPASPVDVNAGATAANGFITAIRVYVDNVAQVLINNPQQTKSFGFEQGINMSSGTHHLVVVGYQSDGGAQTGGVNVTVQ